MRWAAPGRSSRRWALFAELGGKIHLNAEVEEILVDDGARRVTGIRLADGTVHRADQIVSNADVGLHLPQPDPGSVTGASTPTARSTA